MSLKQKNQSINSVPVLSSVCPVSAKFSKPIFLIMYASNFNIFWCYVQASISFPFSLKLHVTQMFSLRYFGREYRLVQQDTNLHFFFFQNRNDFKVCE